MRLERISYLASRIVSGEIVHQATVRITALIPRGISDHRDKQGNGHWERQVFLIFIIPFRHAASRTVNLDHVRSLKGGFLTRATEKRTLPNVRVGALD
jgi:hypothetical protein